MNLPITQSLWIGNPLSKLEQLCIQSFLDNGHEFHLYVYDKIGNIPPGAIVKDGNEILSSDYIFRDDQGSVASFSDWFRYALLVKRGGFWVDMDMVCLKPFDFDTAQGLIFGMEKENLAGVSVIGGEHGVLPTLRDACRTFPRINPWDGNKTKLRKLRRQLFRRGHEGARYGSIGGPLPFTDTLRYFNLLDLGKPPEVFYPIASPDWHSIFDETFANGITWDVTRTEQNRTEQNRTEQNRTEQNRTEQNRTEQNRTEQNRTEQNRTEHSTTCPAILEQPRQPTPGL